MFFQFSKILNSLDLLHKTASAKRWIVNKFYYQAAKKG